MLTHTRERKAIAERLGKRGDLFERRQSRRVAADSHQQPWMVLPLQLAVVEGVAAIQGSGDSLLGSEGQGHHLGGDVLLHSVFLLSRFADW